jgi:UDP-N-acetylglucosamine 1-carboxyvinyltransferase
MHEARQLVAREERLLQRRVAGQREVLGVGEDGVDDFLWIALLAEDRCTVLRVLVERRVHLVIEVVEERRNAPELFVAAELARVRSSRRLDSERVPKQRFALCVLRERLPGFVAGGRRHLARIPAPMAQTAADAFVIEGARPLNGRIRAAGNKNGALPILAACLLTEDEVVLHDVPRIIDVLTMIDLLVDIGVVVEWIGPNDVRVRAANVTKTELDEELCKRIRASVLLAGPLLARFGNVVVPPPGGDVIGRRRVDTHIHAFEQFGAQIDANRTFTMTAGRLVGKNIFLDEASVTGTENAVMAAVLAKGETVLGNSACEPHVQDLCRFLCALGAQIDGIETNVLRIQGSDSLHGTEYTIGPDHIEIASFIGLGAITEGEIVIENCRQQDLVAIMPVFRRLGIKMEVAGTEIRVLDGQELVIEDDIGGAIPKIDDGPWPAFPADLTSIAVAVATQASGTVMIFEKMFENRLFFVDKLVGLGARIILCDPHRVVVTGPARLYGERMSSPDIRAGMAMLLAALCAEGTSTIGNVREIDRGYERIDERLRALGASIERVHA